MGLFLHRRWERCWFYNAFISEPLAAEEANKKQLLAVAAVVHIKTPYTPSEPRRCVCSLSSSSLSQLNKFPCSFPFVEPSRAISVLLCLPSARDCLRCFFAAAALLQMEAKPACNSLWQVIQTHNIRIRSSHWSSQLKKPPQAIARRLLAVAAEFRALKIYLSFHGEIPGNFVEIRVSLMVKSSRPLSRFFAQQFCFSSSLLQIFGLVSRRCRSCLICVVKRCRWINQWGPSLPEWSWFRHSQSSSSKKKKKKSRNKNCNNCWLSYIDRMLQVLEKWPYCLKRCWMSVRWIIHKGWNTVNPSAAENKRWRVQRLVKVVSQTTRCFSCLAILSERSLRYWCAAFQRDRPRSRWNST